MQTNEVAVMIACEDGILLVKGRDSTGRLRLHLPRANLGEGDDAQAVAVRAVADQTGEYVEASTLRLMGVFYDKETKATVQMFNVVLGDGGSVPERRHRDTVIARRAVATDCIATNRALANYFR